MLFRRCFIFILGENGGNYRNGITADRELEQFFPLYTPFPPAGWMETFTSVDSDVNGRTNAFSVGQIELTYTALCADCSRNCDSFGVEKFERFQKAWMGPGLIKGGRCLRGPNMRASSSRSTGSVSVPNDRPPRRVATRRGSRSPQSAAPSHYVFRCDISIVDASRIKLLCSRAYALRINLPARVILGGNA